MALESVSTKNERKSIELAPKKVILVRREKNQKLVNIEEMIFYSTSWYLKHNENRTFIPDIPSEEPSFEVMASNLKKILKSIKDHENIGLKNKVSYRWVVINDSDDKQSTKLIM